MLFSLSVASFIYATHGNQRLIPIGCALIAACLVILLIGRFDHWDEINMTQNELFGLSENVSTTSDESATTVPMIDGDTTDSSWPA